MNVLDIYQGSNGEATKRMYDELTAAGPIGLLAVNLFRAQKASARAKVYRGGNFKGRYRDQAYQKKQWSMENLCHILESYGEKLGIRWGWKEDLRATYHNQVLYIDLPNGQVSFHTDRRLEGPDYPGDWDGQHRSAQRIIIFADKILRNYHDSLTSENPGDSFASLVANRGDYATLEEDPDRSDKG